MDASRIFHLYDQVLSRTIAENGVSEKEIRNAILSMHTVYNKEVASLCSVRSAVADYNDAAHRCAYLHKYAAFHTALVQDLFTAAIMNNYRLFYQQVFTHNSHYKICCLGGGPGNDVIAVLSALHHFFSYFPVAATVVDYMLEWQQSFCSILQELGSGYYGAFGNNCHHFLNWRYLGANLLKPLEDEVKTTISSADLVTMVKFVSATACLNTESMIFNVFCKVKPGGIILFIDNAAGGYQEIVTRAATEYNFVPIYGPLKHQTYQLEGKIRRFGYFSCCKTSVAVHVWMKQHMSYGHPMTDSPLLFPQFSPWPRLGPSPPRLPLNSPLTPFVYVANRENIPEVTVERNQSAREDFTKDVKLRGSDFVSPLLELPQSPNNLAVPSYLATPLTSNIINTPVVGCPILHTPKLKSKKGRRGNPGCNPFNRLRHHVSKKIHNVKYRAKSLFKRAPLLRHPVFHI